MAHGSGGGAQQGGPRRGPPHAFDELRLHPYNLSGASNACLNLFPAHTPQTVTQILFTLLSHPQYIDPLRAEIDQEVANKGWTKDALEEMRFLESSMKESQRLHVVGSSEFVNDARAYFFDLRSDSRSPFASDGHGGLHDC
jgi:hypothetical protein